MFTPSKTLHKPLTLTGPIVPFSAFVDTIYKESVQYFADTEEDLKSDGHFVPYDSDNINSLSIVNGPVNKGIQLYARYRFKLVAPFCFDRPSVCTEGLSMALWVKYPGHTMSSTFFLRPALNKVISRSHYNNHEGFGVRAVIEDRRQGLVEAFVTSKTHRCSYRYVYYCQPRLQSSSANVGCNLSSSREFVIVLGSKSPPLTQEARINLRTRLYYFVICLCESYHYHGLIRHERQALNSYSLFFILSRILLTSWLQLIVFFCQICNQIKEVSNTNATKPCEHGRVLAAHTRKLSQLY